MNMLKNGWYKPSVLKYINNYGPSLKAAVPAGTNSQFRLADSTGELFHFENIRDLYICPLCLSQAIYKSRDYLNLLIKHQWPIDFNEEHYPAESLGGRSTVLVCKDCNSRYGAQTDNMAKLHLAGRQFLQGIEGSGFSTTVKIPWHDKPFKMKSEWKDGILTTIPPKKFNPPVISEVWKKYEEGETFHIEVIADVPKHSFLRKSLLRAAYLKCFTVFGFDFAMSAIPRKIIEVVDGELEHPSESLGVYFTRKTLKIKNGIHQVLSENGYRYFAVFFDIKLQTNSYSESVFVLIPHNTDISWQSLASLPSTNEPLRLKMSDDTITNLLRQGIYKGYSNR